MANGLLEKPREDQREGRVELSAGILPSSVRGIIGGTRKKAVWVLESSLTPKQIGRLTILQRRIDANNVRPMRMDLNVMDMIMNDPDETKRRPLTRQDIGKHAIVLYHDELDVLVGLEFIYRKKSGENERMFIEPEDLSPDDVLVVYPEDLGEWKELIVP